MRFLFAVLWCLTVGGTAVQAAPAKALAVDVDLDDDEVVISFPWEQRVAAAAFKRGGHVWVVFSKRIAVDMQDFQGIDNPWLRGGAKLIEHKKATILRLPVPEQAYPTMQQADNSLGWKLTLAAKQDIQDVPLRVVVSTDPPAPPHVFVAALETAEPVTVKDPDVGDKWVIVPMFQPFQRMAPLRGYVDFALPETAQGVAVLARTDEAYILPQRNGLRVVTRDGAVLTPGAPDIADAKKEVARMTSGTLFPYAEWKIEEKADFAKYVASLFFAIAGSDHVAESNQYRLQLAQTFLAEGMAAEAQGILQQIKRVSPEMYAKQKLAALNGAAMFLMARYGDASKEFSMPELDRLEEVTYWRNMVAELLGNPEQNFDYLALYPKYFTHYPPRIKQQLAIVAADRAIAAKDYSTPLKIFDTLTGSAMLYGVQDYINYLTGKISAETGQIEGAREIWSKLAADYKNPFVRARAEFSLIVMGLQQGTLEREEAIVRLERLHMTWRGDSLELQMLKIMSDLYVEKEDYVSALKAWRQISMMFPNTQAAVDARDKMSVTYAKLFNEGFADKLSPLDALGVYYEYRDLTPDGADGERMIRNVADRMVKADLIDKATALLEQQMLFRTEKEERSRAGERLAEYYLIGSKPEKALQSLQQSVYGDNPPELQQRRDQLAAQAFLDLGHYERVLEMLIQDTSAGAHFLRVEVYWRQKDWPKVIEEAEAMIKQRADAAAPLTAQEVSVLLKLAVSYLLVDDQVQLSYLRDYFTPLMQGDPAKPLFDFITSPNVDVSARTFEEAMQSIEATKVFFDNFTARPADLSSSSGSAEVKAE